MALDYSILNKKTNLTKSVDNAKVEYQDLLKQTFNNDVDFTRSCTFIEVTEPYVARPDLVSLAVYGSDQYADILCKINGISNPMELNVGDSLLIPNPVYITELTTVVNSSLDGLIDDEDTTSTNHSLYSLAVTSKKNPDAKRSPNEATINDHNYIVSSDNRIVFY